MRSVPFILIAFFIHSVALGQWTQIATFNSLVSDFETFNGQIFVAGSFSERDGNVATLSSSYDGTNFTDETSLTTNNFGFEAMTVHNANLFAVGNRQDLNVVWNGSAWVSFGAPSRTFTSLTSDGTNLYMGGSDGIVTLYDGTNFTDLPNLTGFDTDIRAMAVFNGQLHVGGAFTESGSTTLNYAARWDGSAWQPLGGGLEDEVLSMAVYNGELYIGGIFGTNSGNPYRGLTKWDGNAFADPQTSGGVVTEISDMGVWNGELYVGGTFLGIGSASGNHAAKWDGTTWTTLGALSITSTVDEIGFLNGAVFISSPVGFNEHRMFQLGTPVSTPEQVEVPLEVKRFVYEDEIVLRRTGSGQAKRVKGSLFHISGQLAEEVIARSGELTFSTVSLMDGVYLLRLTDEDKGQVLYQDKVVLINGLD